MAPKLQALSRACGDGKLASCVVLGALLDSGLGAPNDALAAVNLFWKACQGGDLDGCARLADVSFAGVGAPFHPACGESFLEVACARGGAAACADLGEKRGRGALVPLDKQGGVALLRKACDLGSHRGCKGLIDAGGAGEDIYQRYEKAAEAACDRGLSEACSVLAKAYHPYPDRSDEPPFGRAWRAKSDHMSFDKTHEFGRKACLAPLGSGYDCTRISPAKEVEILTEACDAGDLEPCIDLGFKVTQDKINRAPTAAPKASSGRSPSPEDLFRRACLGGVSRGCWAMAGTSPETIAARKTACIEGELEACHPTGVEYSRGENGRAWSSDQRAFACEHGSAMDCRAIAEELSASKRGSEPQILALLEKACPPFSSRWDTRDLDARACERLGHRYRRGEGVTRDPLRAVRLLRQACFADGRYNERGIGCAELAEMFDTGDGVPPDPDRATDIYAGLCFAQPATCPQHMSRIKAGASLPGKVLP